MPLNTVKKKVLNKWSKLLLQKLENAKFNLKEGEEKEIIFKKINEIEIRLKNSKNKTKDSLLEKISKCDKPLERITGKKGRKQKWPTLGTKETLSLQILKTLQR